MAAAAAPALTITSPSFKLVIPKSSEADGIADKPCYDSDDDGNVSNGANQATSCMSTLNVPKSPNLSSDDELSDWDMPVEVDLSQRRKKKQSSWHKIRKILYWSPFIQQFKRRKYPWIQLAGHQGNFQAGDPGTVLKKCDAREEQCFKQLMSDVLRPYAPEYRGNVEKEDENYIQLQDLLCEFDSPCVMDIKMGIRTYLEEELEKAREKPKLRKDMYQKMIDVDPEAPTAEEHAQKGVVKARYMQWRDTLSSSTCLGFRIEGIKRGDGGSSKDFKKTRSEDQVLEILRGFIGDNKELAQAYSRRLKAIRATQEGSEFFASHEIVGSSLLFVHDKNDKANIWMIDFGKTSPLPKGVRVNHRSEWKEGNHEDGYLFGLDFLITIVDRLL